MDSVEQRVRLSPAELVLDQGSRDAVDQVATPDHGTASQGRQASGRRLRGDQVGRTDRLPTPPQDFRHPSEQPPIRLAYPPRPSSQTWW